MKNILLISTTIVLFFSCSKEIEEVYLLDKPEIFYPFHNNYYLLQGFSTNVCFHWEEVANATHYYVEVANCNNYESFIFQETIHDNTRLCVQLADLSCTTNLKWRVQALGDNGEKSEFSNAFYKEIEQVPNIETYCCLPMNIPITFNGDLQIPEQNLDTVFINTLEEVEYFNCFDMALYSITFLNQESIFYGLQLSFSPEDGVFSPTYFQINETDSILITGNVIFGSDYYFESFNLNFSNSAIGNVIGTLE